jgi:hypothetical protein
MSIGTYKGDVFTLQDTPVVGTLPRAAVAGGIVYCSVDRTVAATGTGLTLASTHKVGKLPKNAVVLYSIVWPIATATFDAPDATTAATTGTLGTAADPDLFGDVGALNSVTIQGQIIIPKPDGTTYTNTLKPLAADVDVIFTSASNDWTNAEGIAVMIFYTIAGQIS